MMKLYPLPGVRVAAFSIAVLCAIVPPALALQVPREATRFDRVVIPDPSIAVSPEPLSPVAALIPESARAAWNSFKSRYGPNWDVYLDRRSGAPLLVQGQGIPFVPGSGNALRSAAPASLDSLATSLRAFALENASLLHADAGQLDLNREGSGELAHEVWKVVFDRVIAGVPVAGDRYIFCVGHGNLIAFGAPRWSSVDISPVAALPSFDAVAIVLLHMGIGGDEKVSILDEPRLTYLPLAAGGSADTFDGVMGKGYAAALAWRVELEVEGEPGRWVGMVDGNTGNVLALDDAIQYAQVKGGTYPLTDDGICPDGCEQAGFPMPWANISIGANSTTATSMGGFTCAPGGSTATTTLSAQYVRVVDRCGAISQSVACDADLNLGVSTGTDCTIPAGASAGNTHATRSSFYHLNRIKEHARAWLPANAWLAGQLRDRVNINQTCNAFWNSGGATGTVNSYRSGGG
jgi:hypothetical protein